VTQRERLLSMAVAGLLIAVGVHWGIGKYRTALQTRYGRLDALRNEQQLLNERLLAGAYADRQMGEYLVRSLPSDPEVARSQYQTWLLATVRDSGLVDAVVDPTTEIPAGDLYRRFGFRVTGRADLEDVVRLLHAIHRHDTLHRVVELNLTPGRNDQRLNVEMGIDAISLSAAPAKGVDTPSGASYRIASSLSEAKDAILNRNFFEPPNQAPKYGGDDTVVATRGETTRLELSFVDPEGTALVYQSDAELPSWARLDASSGELILTPPESVDLDTQVDWRVTVRDEGFPPRQTSQQLTVRLRDRPTVVEPDVPPEFDDATQTYLTALLHGKEPTAWMNVRTRGKTLKLRVGDSFEIGSIRGTVTEVTARVVKLEVDGREVVLRPSERLSEAAEAAKADATQTVESESAEPEESALPEDGAEPKERAESEDGAEPEHAAGPEVSGGPEEDDQFGGMAEPGGSAEVEETVEQQSPSPQP